MKEKILIIGLPGTGKTKLARLLAVTDHREYTVVDGVPSALWLSLNAETGKVYVSNSITGAEAAIYLKDFTVIAVSEF